MTIELEATQLRGKRYAVRPQGRLGTCGWLPDGTPWTVEYVTARNGAEAIRKARLRRYAQKEPTE